MKNVLFSLLLIIVTLTLIACSGNNTQISESRIEFRHVITNGYSIDVDPFDPVPPATVLRNETIDKPAINKASEMFNLVNDSTDRQLYWLGNGTENAEAFYSDKEGTMPFDFSQPVTGDTTIYVIWNRPDNKGQLQIMVNQILGWYGNNSDLNHIDTSKVTDMSYLFASKHNFNGHIGRWNVSNVETMQRMFSASRKFNRDISQWKVSKVKNMRYMFFSAGFFNQNISGWQVGMVTDMQLMLGGASAFIQDLSGWDVSSVTNSTNVFLESGIANDKTKWPKAWQ